MTVYEVMMEGCQPMIAQEIPPKTTTARFDVRAVAVIGRSIRAGEPAISQLYDGRTSGTIS